ncbi:GNAT family N-acetyltransferase [Vibrio cincinnatiensis]|uniref:GNAT family N-acetyltransferase n=1 Tax=Vibrio cincinnatiensis TaxID=675 RepID=UPI001EDD9C9A|nr:GNAT family N-acetyltransferase [Vibrio cincinnatiensis]MCG3723735.1 GNAT family N-acetyltransferase [Vibrio cincinnatiensis]MCG3737510.1 GNAT family N-acetyltransferase [Vibrio cincinnatiensis]
MKIEIFPISSEFDQPLANIIKTVGAEFGAIGEGFGPSDAEVNNMSRYYQSENKSGYWIATLNGQLMGGGGIAPFNGSHSLCELKKLFLLPESRGYGIGKAIVEQCLSFAQQQGFTQCYLDTLSTMESAIHLYQTLGFTLLSEPMLGTEHNGCDVWMIKTL